MSILDDGAPDDADIDGRKHVSEYTGPDRYNEWIEDYLGLELSEPQKEIGRAVAEHERVLVIGANGFGKSYMLAAVTLAYLFTNYPASVLATSGTYGKLRRTYCKPIEQMHRQAWGLPGEYKKTPPRIEIEDDPSIYFQASSPTDPGELEGVHNTYTLGVVEEADKDRVDEDVFDSMESLLTDHRDRLVAVANPPKDDANIVSRLLDDDEWHKLRYSSFQSHNVQVELEYDKDAKDADGEYVPVMRRRMIDGLVTLDRIKDDWRSWNGEPWPGVEEARTSHTRGDLDVRWYRRRLGVMPPDTADAHRPFTPSDVEAAWEREPAHDAPTPDGLALDVARMGGDYNAFTGVFGDALEVIEYWRGDDHVENEQRVRGDLEGAWDCQFAVDAVNEGSGLADRIDTFYPETFRFQAGSNAVQQTRFKSKWAEGMYLLGEFLRNGGSIDDRRLREELLAAGRCLEYDTRYLASRSAEVLTLTSKEEIKDRLGRSPDLLDGAYMACWAASEETRTSDTVPATW